MAKDLGTETKRLKDTTNLLGSSAEEYIAARCLTINHMSFVAYPLFAVSIEKILKAIICEKNSALSPKSMGHNIVKLFNEVNQFKDYDVAKYESYIPKLEKLYNVRYHDSGKVGEFTMGLTDYDTIDDIYIELADQINIIPEIKVRCGLMPIIFDKYDQYRPVKHWAFMNNKALSKKLPGWNVYHNKYYRE